MFVDCASFRFEAADVALSASASRRIEEEGLGDARGSCCGPV